MDDTDETQENRVEFTLHRGMAPMFAVLSIALFIGGAKAFDAAMAYEGYGFFKFIFGTAASLTLIVALGFLATSWAAHTAKTPEQFPTDDDYTGKTA